MARRWRPSTTVMVGVPLVTLGAFLANSGTISPDVLLQQDLISGPPSPPTSVTPDTPETAPLVAPKAPIKPGVGDPPPPAAGVVEQLCDQSGALRSFIPIPDRGLVLGVYVGPPPGKPNTGDNNIIAVQLFTDGSVRPGQIVDHKVDLQAATGLVGLHQIMDGSVDPFPKKDRPDGFTDEATGPQVYRAPDGGGWSPVGATITLDEGTATTLQLGFGVGLMPAVNEQQPDKVTGTMLRVDLGDGPHTAVAEFGGQERGCRLTA